MWGLSLVEANGIYSSSRCTGLSLSRPLLLRSTGSRRAGSVVVAHGPSCSTACGIFPHQGSNLCPLHWQADSQPLRHQGSPWLLFLTPALSQTHTCPACRIYLRLYPNPSTALHLYPHPTGPPPPTHFISPPTNAVVSNLSLHLYSFPLIIYSLLNSHNNFFFFLTLLF